jgi:hypothetical protein
MAEYRDMAVVFVALSLVAVLVLLAATVQGPRGQGIGTAQAARPTRAAARIRFGEPIIQVHSKDIGSAGASSDTSVSGNAPPAIPGAENPRVSFSDYVFTIDSSGMRKAIESIAPALVECYVQWNSLDDSVGVGAWYATFHFKTGSKKEQVKRVSNIQLDHPSPDAEVMEQCMMEMFGMLRFDVKGPRKFRHPVVFQ